MKRALILLALIASCDQVDETAEAKACRRRAPTVGEGIAGCTIFTGDMPPIVVRVFGNIPIEVRRLEDDRPVVLKLQSDRGGFFDAALGPGSYLVCHQQGCRPVTVASGRVVRFDLDVTGGG